jgi:hypothetical protein
MKQQASFRTGLIAEPFNSRPQHWDWSGTIIHSTANVNACPGSNQGDLKAALTSDSWPLITCDSMEKLRGITGRT